MSWLYRFFTKSDNEQVVTVTAPYIQFTGAATFTGAVNISGGETQDWLTINGAATVGSFKASTAATIETLAVPGTMRVGGAATIVGAWTMSSTARVVTSPLYLGTGTIAIVFGTSGIDPINTGIAGSYDKGSLFLGGTANCYYKTGYASTEWASVDAVD